MDAFKNFAVAAVATAPSPASSGTNLVVTATHGLRFPAPPFNAAVWPNGSLPDPGNAEIVRVTAIAADSFTLARTQEGTLARTIVVGDLIAQAVTKKLLDDLAPPLIVKMADQSSVNATLQDDTDFAVTVLPNEVWAAQGTLFVSGGTTGDLNWTWSAPAGATGWNSGTRMIGGTTAVNADIATSAVEDLTDTGIRTAGLAGTAAPVVVRVYGVLINGPNAGTFRLRWSQSAVDAANPTVVHSGSYMIFFKRP